MPHISNKGKRMPASPIRKLTPFAEKAVADGKKVYHLNIGNAKLFSMYDITGTTTISLWLAKPL